MSLTTPALVGELRSLFKAGATPSALIRLIVDRHPDEPGLDGLVRAYFREAFCVPVLRVGAAQVREISAGSGPSSLAATVLPQMIAMRPEWDHDADNVECWLDHLHVTDEAALIESVEPAAIPELSGSWDHMDETARRFVQRLIGNCRSLQEKLSAVAALAERLQDECSEFQSDGRG